MISSTNKSLIWQLIIFDDQKDINYNYFYEMTDTISCRKFYKNETRHSYAVKDADKDEHKIVQFNQKTGRILCKKMLGSAEIEHSCEWSKALDNVSWFQHPTLYRGRVFRVDIDKNGDLNFQTLLLSNS